jgi:phage terminase large subunit-like protein
MPLAQLIENELARRGDRPRHVDDFYPDDGKFRRELYPRHLEFFAAGTKYRERLMLAANRVGKTEGVGLYEMVLHLTGLYPSWWKGRRFNRPIRAWACGDTGKTVREIIQYKLLGPPKEIGSGILPAHLIHDTKRGSGVADSIEVVYVKHVGGISQLLLKSYDQRREGFQGTEQDVILLDEEPPLAVYTECLLRTMTNDGMLMLTFTPLLGLSDVVLQFCEGGRIDLAMPGKFVVSATWDDVPHLSAAAKEELYASIPPYQRDARSKGVPQLGSGAIYPIPESEIIVKPFEIPKFWPKAYGMDVGWNRTACVWGAYDRDSGVRYLFSEHYRGQAEPSVHAHAISARGVWIPGAIDPAARGRNQDDGAQLLQQYTDLGLQLTKAQNAVEAGIYEVWQGLSSGKLKVFENLQHWRAEYRIYRRDEKGRVVKEHDHLMDGTRYYMLTGKEIECLEPKKKSRELEHANGRNEQWMTQ